MCGVADYIGISINGGTPNGLFVMENPTEMDDNWGYHHLWKPPYLGGYPLWEVPS